MGRAPGRARGDAERSEIFHAITSRSGLGDPGERGRLDPRHASGERVRDQELRRTKREGAAPAGGGELHAFEGQRRRRRIEERAARERRKHATHGH